MPCLTAIGSRVVGGVGVGLAVGGITDDIDGLGLLNSLGILGTTNRHTKCLQ